MLPGSLCGSRFFHELMTVQLWLVVILMCLRVIKGADGALIVEAEAGSAKQSVATELRRPN